MAYVAAVERAREICVSALPKRHRLTRRGVIVEPEAGGRQRMIRHTRVGKAHAAKNGKAVGKNRRAAARHGPAAHALRHKGYGVSFRAGDEAVAQPRCPLDRQAGALPCGKAVR